MRSNILTNEQFAFLQNLERWTLTEITHPNSGECEVFYLKPDGHKNVWCPEARCFFFASNFEELFEQVQKKAERYDAEDNLNRWLVATHLRDQLEVARSKFQAEKTAWLDLVSQFTEFMTGKPLVTGLTGEALAFLNQPATEACYF